jgi:lipopolysaccharide export system protein LptA
MPRTDPFKAAILLLGAAALPVAAHAQAIDLSHGGPVTVTALGGIDWNQADQTVTAHDDARAVRGNVTVTGDRLIAHYRKKGTGPNGPGAKPGDAPPPPTPVAATTGAPTPGAPDDTGNNEIYRLDADGHVHIYTPTDQAWGDHAIYDIDQAVLVMTGKAMKLTTPQDVMTARDTMEYWSQKHMAVGRGDASVTNNDGRRITGDTLVGYTVDNNAPPAPGAKPPPPKPAKTDDSTDTLGASGKLQRVEAFGHVQVRTATEIVNGDRGVYLPDTGLARIVGHVHITRGENVLNGSAAIVNMKTGLATMTEAPGARVHGLIVPNEQQPKTGQPDATKATTSGDQPAAKSDDSTTKDDK